jgi:hypothetical protein
MRSGDKPSGASPYVWCEHCQTRVLAVYHRCKKDRQPLPDVYTVGKAMPPPELLATLKRGLVDSPRNPVDSGVDKLQKRRAYKTEHERKRRAILKGQRGQ